MKSKILYVIIIVLVILNGLTYKLLTSKTLPVADLCFYEADNNYVLVEKNEINKSFTSYLYKDNNNKFLSKIYKYNSEEELSIKDLIKSDKLEEFNNKINDLVYLKYPKFIADVLVKEEVTKSYLLRDNELVIYYNDYVITPEVNELLFLKVNYNEIKDCLNFTVILDSKYENESGYNYTNAKKSIAITFDDSPNKNKTNKILEYLQDNHFRATFFVVGEKVNYNTDLLLEIKNSGNEVGSHTYKHDNMSKMSDDELIEDFKAMNDLYESIFQKKIDLVRPPYGSIKKSQLDLIDASFVLWSLDTNDWRYRNSDYLINYVLDNVRDGDIILFHDSYDSTVNAIQELLPILYGKGYQVMGVSELFKLKGKSLEKNVIVHNAY